MVRLQGIRFLNYSLGKLNSLIKVNAKDTPIALKQWDCFDYVFKGQQTYQSQHKLHWIRCLKRGVKVKATTFIHDKMTA
jgi:hypothetical protein